VVIVVVYFVNKFIPETFGYTLLGVMPCLSEQHQIPSNILLEQEREP